MDLWAYDSPVLHLRALANNGTSNQREIQIASEWPGKVFNDSQSGGSGDYAREYSLYLMQVGVPIFHLQYIPWNLHT